MISSVANPTIKRVRRLRKRLWRERKQRILVEGHHAVTGALSAHIALDEVFHTPAASRVRGGLLGELGSGGARLIEVTDEVMAHLSSPSTAPDLLAVAPLVEQNGIELPGVLLSAVRDPGTVGSILASAVACGIRSAAIPPGTADVFDQKVVRVARGAHFHLGIVRVASEAAAIGRARADGGRIIVVGEKGLTPWEADLAGPCLFVICGEGAETVDVEPDVCVAVPARAVPPSVAARAAVVLFEWARRAAVHR